MLFISFTTFSKHQNKTLSGAKTPFWREKMQRSCPASLRQVVQDAGKRQQRWLCQLPGNLTCVWHSQQWWWAEAVAGLVFSVLLPRAGLHDWTADSRGKAAAVPEWGQRRLLRVPPAGVCMKEVVAMAVPSQRSELWASGGFQGSETFLLGANQWSQGEWIWLCF